MQEGSTIADHGKSYDNIAISIASIASLLVAGCTEDPKSLAGVTDTKVTVTEHPERVYWGDLHLHTLYSFDSYNFGNKTLGPDEAYRFAKGELVDAHGGKKAQLQQPLDFLMVSDHAEFTGVFLGMENEDPRIIDSPLGKAWADMAGTADIAQILGELVGMINGTREKRHPPEAFKKTVWSELITAAERHNQPGKFTTFAGYEWTAMANGGNQHRVVVFKDGINKTSQTIPFSAVDSNNPLDLWRYLASYEKQTGGEVLAIAHNGNVSNGDMFGFEQVDGAPFNEEYVRMRARWEPLYEITQVKGDSEAHPLLSPTDEFADFETWDETNIAMIPRPSDPQELRTIVAGEYAREGLKQGLELRQQFGINPYQYGLIGSTDAHTGLSTADDDNFWGKFVESEPSETRLTSKMGGQLWDNWRLTGSGYVGAWAKANTREELFAAFKRREVYATTGPRISVRFFGGWNYSAVDLEQSNLVHSGYTKGVPMGGIMGGSGAAPRFMIAATKDANGANLDRMQVIKGWRSADGALHEKIYEVAFSGDREPDPKTGKLSPIGSTIDFETASYTNSIGEAYLSTLWMDPDFDPKVSAFYYVRVLEIPTPRWTLYDAVRFKVTPPKGTPLVTQERAYSSPIWYEPPKDS